jgi:hypothetical protein
MWHKWQGTPNGGWSGLGVRRRRAHGDVAVASNAEVASRYFAGGTDSNALWHDWQEQSHRGSRRRGRRRARCAPGEELGSRAHAHLNPEPGRRIDVRLQRDVVGRPYGLANADGWNDLDAAGGMMPAKGRMQPHRASAGLRAGLIDGLHGSCRAEPCARRRRRAWPRAG